MNIAVSCTITDSVFKFSLCPTKGTTGALKEAIIIDSKIFPFLFIYPPLKFEIDNAIEEMNYEMTEIETITDKKEWFIAYKNIIEEYSYIIDPPETIYDYFSEEELDLLFHVVQAEVGDEYSFESKVNVANVIFNRFYHERFPNTLSDILVCDQFSPIADGRYREVEVTEDTILACEYAFMLEDTTDGCLFFDSNNTLNYQFVFDDGAHNFYKYREE